jgi:transposase
MTRASNKKRTFDDHQAFEASIMTMIEPDPIQCFSLLLASSSNWMYGPGYSPMQNPAEPIVQRIHSTREREWHHHIGAISTLFAKPHWHLATSTCTDSVVTYIKSLALKIMNPSNTILAMDNHPAHRSVALRDFVRAKGLAIFFLPPNASHVNPIERRM